MMNNQTNNKAKTLVLASVAMAALSACSTFDCPLSNRVHASFSLKGEVKTLSDSLTVSTPRDINNPEEDTVLINRITDTDSLQLPMSYQRKEDVFYFTLAKKDTTLIINDTVWIEKENLPHFESIDCNPAIFHIINGVRFTTNAIDSIVVNYNKVTYNDAKAHFLIYFKGGTD